MAFYTFDLDQTPNYQFKTDIPGSAEFTIGLRYVERNDSWLFDLFDSTGSAIVVGLAVVLNKPLLSQIVDARRPPGDFFFIEDGDTGVEAGFSDLGTRVKLWYADAT